eukprot:4823125-Amphidinium_carterae.2
MSQTHQSAAWRTTHRQQPWRPSSPKMSAMQSKLRSFGKGTQLERFTISFAQPGCSCYTSTAWCMQKVACQMPSQESMGGKTQKFLHTSPETLTRMLSESNIGSRCLFDSPSPAGMHRMSHHHYDSELSAARITEQGCLIVGIWIAEDYLVEHASTAVNWYATSLSLQSIPVDEAEVSLFSCVHISPSLIQALMQ